MRLCVHCNMRRHIEWTASSVPFIWYHKIFNENFNPCASSSSSNIAKVQHRRSTTNAPCQCHTTLRHILRSAPLEPHLLQSHPTFLSFHFWLNLSMQSLSPGAHVRVRVHVWRECIPCSSPLLFIYHFSLLSLRLHPLTPFMRRWLLVPLMHKFLVNFE